MEKFGIGQGEYGYDFVERRGRRGRGMKEGRKGKSICMYGGD